MSSLLKFKQIENLPELQTLTGVADGSADFGTFTGTTLTDNLALKPLLQEIETALEGTFYVSDGTLSGARTVTMGGNDLTFDGTGDVVISDAGNVEVGGGSLTTAATTANLFNANATTVNIAGAGTTVGIGAGTGTTTVNNDLAVAGNLTVQGTTTTVESTTVTVADKNIELGVTGTPTDVTADGGGITLKGATDKTFNWVDATDAWTSSEHMALASGKDLILNGATSGAVTIAAADTTTAYTLVLPADDGTTGQFLQTDGAGVTTWTTVSTSITAQDITPAVTAASTNVALTLSSAPANGVNSITSVAVNGKELCASEVISVVGTALTINVPYALDANDRVVVKYIA